MLMQMLIFVSVNTRRDLNNADPNRAYNAAEETARQFSDLVKHYLESSGVDGASFLSQSKESSS